MVDSLPAGERDCREIVLELQPRGGATVAMTTGDGRLAVRPVTRPDEVVPIVRALMVSVPAPSAVAAPSASDPARDVRADAPPSRALTRAGATSEGRAIVVAGGGGEMGFTGNLASPAARLTIAAIVGHFELGAFVGREFGYRAVAGSAPDGFQLSTTSFGLQAGYRVPIQDVALVGGFTAGAALVREQVGTANLVEGMGVDMTEHWVAGPPATYGPTEARAGAYVGAVFPLHFRFRLRPQFGVDFVAFRGGDSVPAEKPMPALPSWIGMATLAVEGTAL
jgi:hypothetical protein